MTADDDLDRILAGWFEAEALAPAPAGRLQQAVDATRRTRPRPVLTAGLGSGWVEPRLGARVPRLPWRLIGALALLGVALAVAGVLVGSELTTPKPLVTAKNGLIAYEYDGDIYVGDPATGESRAIARGPAHESSPYFSPDGTLIAFARNRTPQEGIPTSEGYDIVIVSPDGTDERVITPPGFTNRSAGMPPEWFAGEPFFGWTPDSRWIVADGRNNPVPAYQGGGGASLLDVYGVEEPRLLVPPFGTMCGPCFAVVNGVAADFRPSTGNVVLARTDDGGVNLFDIASQRYAPLGADEALGRYSPYSINAWSWSPDGSRIALQVDLTVDTQFVGRALVRGLSLVMNADGSEPVRVAEIGPWSPDGSRMATHLKFDTPGSLGGVIQVVNVGSGGRDLLATFSDDPPGTPGWSWSPDGTGILFLEHAGAHPMVVDVETDQAIELPWTADRPPSWQALRDDPAGGSAP